MRSIGQVFAFIVAALIIGVAAQVLISQSREQGAFFERVATVLGKQFGGARAVVPAPVRAAEATGRSLDGTALPPEMEAAVQLTADRLSAVTQRELAALKADLVRAEETRDRDSFWTDVRLNTLFMLLGLAAPVLLRRFGVNA